MAGPGTFRATSAGGFAAGVTVGAFLASRLDAGWWLGLPTTVAYAAAAAGFVVHLLALKRRDVRWEMAAYLLAGIGLSRLPAAAPNTITWFLAAVGALGFILALEASATARRLDRLAIDEGEPPADAERSPGPAAKPVGRAHLDDVSTPLLIAFATPFGAALVGVLVARALGGAVLGLAGPALKASLEAASLGGTAVGLGVLAVLLGLAAWARHHRQLKVWEEAEARDAKRAGKDVKAPTPTPQPEAAEQG